MSMTAQYIYKITNKINNKIYIGKSKNPATRFVKHIKIAETYLESDNHFQAIHGSIKKYSKENFTLDIMEICDESNVNEREIYWISLLNAQNKIYGYNLTLGGDGVINRSEETINKWRTKMLGRKHSLDHNRKISESNMGKTISLEVRSKISQANSGKNNGMYGKTISDKTRIKLSNFQSSRERNPLTEEHKQKNREATSKQDFSFRIPVEVKNEIVKLYNTGNFTKRQLSEKFVLKYNSVVKIIRTNKKVL
jgi:group I intron endonuclease